MDYELTRRNISTKIIKKENVKMNKKPLARKGNLEKKKLGLE